MCCACSSILVATSGGVYGISRFLQMSSCDIAFSISRVSYYLRFFFHSYNLCFVITPPHRCLDMALCRICCKLVRIEDFWSHSLFVVSLAPVLYYISLSCLLGTETYVILRKSIPTSIVPDKLSITLWLYVSIKRYGRFILCIIRCNLTPPVFTFPIFL